MQTKDIQATRETVAQLVEHLKPLEAHYEKLNVERYTGIWATVELLLRLDKELVTIQKEMFDE